MTQHPLRTPDVDRVLSLVREQAEVLESALSRGAADETPIDRISERTDAIDRAVAIQRRLRAECPEWPHDAAKLGGGEIEACLSRVAGARDALLEETQNLQEAASGALTTIASELRSIRVGTTATGAYATKQGPRYQDREG